MRGKNKGMWGFGWVGRVVGKGVGSQEGRKGEKRGFNDKMKGVEREPRRDRGCTEERRGVR